jgi:hypothetical protein
MIQHRWLSLSPDSLLPVLEGTSLGYVFWLLVLMVPTRVNQDEKGCFWSPTLSLTVPLQVLCAFVCLTWVLMADQHHSGSVP